MNKLKGIILVVSICFASIMMPFNIYAQDTAVVVGTDVSLVSTTLLKTDQWSFGGGTYTGYYNQFVYHVSVQLDNNYVGYLLLQMDYSYNNNPQSGLRTDTGSVTRRVFINGDKAEFNFAFTSWYSLDPLLRNTTNGTPNAVIQDQGVTLLSELDSIQHIIDILNDLYNSQDQVEGLLDNQLTQLELVVQNTSLANQYLDLISKLRGFNIPLISYNLNLYAMYKGYEMNENNNSYLINYPSYKLDNGDIVFQFYLNKNASPYYFCFVDNNDISSLSALNNTYSFYKSGTQDLNVSLQYIRNMGYSYGYPTKSTYLVIAKIVCETNGLLTITYRADNNDDFYIPLYFGEENNIKYMDTDLAIFLGFKNDYLNSIDKIANGTTASNNASQQLESDTSDFNTNRDDLIDIEDSMGNNMDSAMNQITPNNNGLSGFGGNFLTSAVWVRTQFERLTNNTPYGSLIVYGMTLGLALLLLGKVML